MTDLDRVTDLFEKWAAEESEHRAAGEYGLAEGLRVAIDDLRAAVHGGVPAVPSDQEAALRVRIAADIKAERDECVETLDDSVNYDRGVLYGLAVAHRIAKGNQPAVPSGVEVAR